MFRKKNQQGRVSLKIRYLMAILAAAMLLIAIGSTLAWMQYSRTLQTLTLVRVSYLDIVGAGENTMAANLGDIDVSSPGEKAYIFGVESNNVEQFLLQLAYTTNIPLEYQVYHAGRLEAGAGDGTGNIVTDKESGFSFSYGEILNMTEKQDNDATYETFSSVQKNAKPQYWQAGPISINNRETAYFILKITWGTNAADVANKETDMVYLTVERSQPQTTESTGGGV